LSRFSRTTRQVVLYLTRKGFSPEEIQEAISFLQEKRYLNDEAFAESFILSRVRHGDGPFKIKQMLFKKGIDFSMTDPLLKKNFPSELQIEQAENLLKRYSRKPKEKLIRFIASRGFPRYVIIQAFKRL
jgi:regulatory protein